MSLFIKRVTQKTIHTIPYTLKMTYPLVCLGNPLLDVQANVTAEYLAKYSLKSNDAILIEDAKNDPRMAIFDDLVAKDTTIFVAGGAAQNTARGAAYELGPNQVAYFGCVGKDKFSEQLLQENEKAGVTSLYLVNETVGTGKCAALINGVDRSLVTDLGAANHFKPEHLDKHWSVVENAKAFYIGGFHLTVSPEAIVKLGKHAKETGKPFVINFSAPFIPQFFKDALIQVLPYATHIIANETEAASFVESFYPDSGIKSDDLAAVAKKIIADYNKKATVIFTHGLEPTVLVKSDLSVEEIAVHALEASKINDTNGAGDAFAGGFVAGLILGESLEKSIDRGQALAKLSIQEVGPSYPKKA